jgi:hypothetical protein
MQIINTILNPLSKISEIYSEAGKRRPDGGSSKICSCYFFALTVINYANSCKRNPSSRAKEIWPVWIIARRDREAEELEER